MKISDLARTTGVPIATVKYYLREGLVPPGVATGATQAQYDETHVARLRLARALVQVGHLSVAAAREVLTAIDTPGQSLHDILGVAHSALPPARSDDMEVPAASALVDDLGWRVHPRAAALRSLEQALRALEDVGTPASREALTRYAHAARQLAENEVSNLPRSSPEEAATAVVIGTVLWEPVLLALRRLAQEAVSAEMFGDRRPAQE